MDTLNDKMVVVSDSVSHNPPWETIEDSLVIQVEDYRKDNVRRMGVVKAYRVSDMIECLIKHGLLTELEYVPENIKLTKLRCCEARRKP